MSGLWSLTLPGQNTWQAMEEEIGGWMGGTHSALLTYSTEDMVTYNEDTSCFDGSARTLRFAAE